MVPAQPRTRPGLFALPEGEGVFQADLNDAKRQIGLRKRSDQAGGG